VIGFFFKDQEVAVVGGGDTAVEEAIYLANICSKVTLIHRRDALRAGKILQDHLFATKNIEIKWNRTVDEIIGDDSGATGIRLKSTTDDSTEEIAMSGVFIAIGHTPNTDFLDDQLQKDRAGYLTVTPGGTATSIEGVFAAGDVADPVYRQAITAAGSGCMAALDAERWLTQQK